MSSEQHKAIVRRFFDEVWNQQQLEAIEDIFAPTILLNGHLIDRTALTQIIASRKVSIALRQIVRCNSGTNPLVTALADTGQAWPTTDPASRGRCGG